MLRHNLFIPLRLRTAMVSLNQLKYFLDRELQIGKFRKDAKNGLAVQGRRMAHTIGIATNTTFEVIRSAAQRKVDFLIVHHGGWKSADRDLLAKKFALLRKHKISLYIAHAPLDCKAGYGNSIALAQHLGLNVVKRFAMYCGASAGVFATQKSSSLSAFARRLCAHVNPHIEYIGRAREKVRKVAIVTGGMGRNNQWLADAIRNGCDTFLCGEANSLFKIYAKEKGITLICAGHTATEVHGLIRLGELLNQKFDLRIIRLKERQY